MYFRTTQTLIIFCVCTCSWLFLKVSLPQEQMHYINFGASVQLISVTPYVQDATPGESIKFKVKWRLLAPLPSDKLIGYYLGNPNNSPLAWVDSRAPSDGSKDYTNVPLEGRIVEDLIKLDVPIETEPGPYEVSTFIFPALKYEIDSSEASPLSGAHRTLFILNVQK